MPFNDIKIRSLKSKVSDSEGLFVLVKVSGPSCGIGCWRNGSVHQPALRTRTADSIAAGWHADEKPGPAGNATTDARAIGGRIKDLSPQTATYVISITLSGCASAQAVSQSRSSGTAQ